ncbi:T9SS type A sorting domain-containing protein [Brumimicrobium oceani]|uniref:Secretion system C-terminal sorting domain-containing protein n=1 Tax=Brumimicrobium oceani TaxID=2100725 RepID=A0A2U2X1C1_9FLAO|nr:T9SS type A sorting domain-containing protein [Brumimicrobium oceani]PWH81583.1 hypothetical protein DIT68_14750 [Brumimicrobium oceani]
MEILRKLLFVSICMVPFLGNTQIAFYKKYTGGPFDQGNGLTQLPDSSYAVTGTSGSFNNTSGQAFLMLVDSLGNQAWTKDYGGSGEDIGVRVLHVPGDGFFIAGYSGSTMDGNFDFVLYKTDEQGNLQWEKMYGGMDWDRLNDAALLSDGGVILVGETKGFLSQKRDIFMVRTTPLGDTVWTKTIRTPEDDFANAVEVLSTNEFIVGGNRGEFGLSKGMLMSYDIDGTENWLEFMDQAGVTTVNDIAIHQSLIYLAGSKDNSTSEKQDLWVAKTNLSGVFVAHYWEAFYDLDTYFSALSVKNADTMYLAMITESPENNPYPGGVDVYVHTYNASNLSFKASRPFSGYNDDVINQFIGTNDGGFALVGTVSDDQENLSSGTNVMLAKIGPNGEDTLDADLDLDLVNLTSYEKKTLTIYPNPTRSDINIPSELVGQIYELRNLQGKTVQTGLVTQKISLYNLDVGIYFLNIKEEDQMWSAKILKR